MPDDADPRVRLLQDLADPTRFGILTALERGPMTATSLTRALDVSPTQLANHLRRLRDAALISAERQGRLAVYRLAEPGLREIFSMLNGLRGTPGTPSPAIPDAVACYDHIGGRVGVAVLDHLIDHGALLARDGEGQLALGPNAAVVLDGLGVDATARSSRRMPAYACMDSTLGRPHLGGRIGADLAQHFMTQGWIQTAATPRQLDLSHRGRQALARLDIAL